AFNGRQHQLSQALYRQLLPGLKLRKLPAREISITPILFILLIPMAMRLFLWASSRLRIPGGRTVADRVARFPLANVVTEHSRRGE
ncbi:MAG TPA: hypothetical protein VMA35_01310, partial [Candidatus Sulfopaludibacter sp.]|nr:hypothetical protein [Candidatus Sulfopaludibacter sp.]